MKFHGELKFPEVDHPGVPVVFVIDDDQAEILVEGESLGRWSLYDIHARRLVASAFQLDLEGTEVTFVAADPIDFAYRGVEHMAKTWAEIKSRRAASRMIAVRKSRRGISESRVEDLRVAMQSNLEDLGPRRIAGEPEQAPGSPIDRIMKSAPQQSTAEVLRRDDEDAIADSGDRVTEDPVARLGGDDWDRRDQIGGIPLAGEEASPVAPIVEPVERPAEDLVEEVMDREEPSETAPVEAPGPTPEQVEFEEERRRLAEERARFEQERQAAAQREADLLEAYKLEMQRLEAEREELRRQAMAAPGPDTREPEASEQDAPSEADDAEEIPPEEIGDEPEVDDDAAAAAYVDLSDIEEPEAPAAATSQPPRRVPHPEPEPEPAMAGSAKDKRGIMGAVKAAFGSGARDHTHSFIEAPGGLGITRYVCEECGYVSISSGN